MKKANGAPASTLRRSVPRVVVAAMAVAFGLFVLAPTVGAVTDGFEIIIDVDTVVFADLDSVTPLETVKVPDEFAGQPCVVTVESQNQSSVHPGNDISVASGGSQVLLPDVEAVPGGTVNGVGQLVLGDTIVVSLIMGPDKVFSAGIDVIVDCTPIPPTEPPVVDVTTTAECNLETFQFVISATNTGEVDLVVELVWDSGALSEILSPGGQLSAVVPFDESYTIEIFGPDEEKIHRETGDAESCDQVSPTSITSPPTTEPPPTSPSTTAEVLPTSITSAPSTTAEVLASDTLPFTGANSGTPALLALALIGIGALALVATRRAED